MAFGLDCDESFFQRYGRAVVEQTLRVPVGCVELQASVFEHDLAVYRVTHKLIAANLDFKGHPLVAMESVRT